MVALGITISMLLESVPLYFQEPTTIRMLIHTQNQLSRSTIYSIKTSMINPNGSTRRSIRLTISTIFKLLPGMMRLQKVTQVVVGLTPKGF